MVVFPVKLKLEEGCYEIQDIKHRVIEQINIYNEKFGTQLKFYISVRIPESDILDITSHYETDSKITKIEYHSYTSYTTSFNNNDEIRISIQQTDVYPYLHESFILSICL